MSTTITGDPTNYPDAITVPSDGDGPGIKADDVLPALQGLMDRTSAIEAILTAPTFPVAITMTSASWAKFRAPNTWYASAPGTDNYFIRTQDPYVWPGSTEDISGAGADLDQDMWDFDVTPTGAILGVANVTGELGGIWRYVGSTWTADNATLAYNTTYPSVVYEPSSGLWCLVFTEEGGVPRILTSPETGASASTMAFTLRSSPASLPADAICSLCTDGAGNILLQAFSPGAPSNMYTSMSANGGVTWSATVTTALGFSVSSSITDGTAHGPVPIWTGSKFVLFAPNLSTPRTKVFTKTAAGSLTLVATLTSVGLIRGAAIGKFIAAADGLGNWLLTSNDYGATWFRGARKLGQTIHCMAASPGQYLFTRAGFAYPSSSFGAGLEEVT